MSQNHLLTSTCIMSSLCWQIQFAVRRNPQPKQLPLSFHRVLKFLFLWHDLHILNLSVNSIKRRHTQKPSLQVCKDQHFKYSIFEMLTLSVLLTRWSDNKTLNDPTQLKNSKELEQFMDSDQKRPDTSKLHNHKLELFHGKYWLTAGLEAPKLLSLPPLLLGCSSLAQETTQPRHGMRWGLIHSKVQNIERLLHSDFTFHSYLSFQPRSKNLITPHST